MNNIIVDDIERYLYIFSKNTRYINEEISEYEYKIIDLLQLSDLEKKKLKSKVYNDIYDREYNIIIEPYIIKIKNILSILSTKSDIKPDLIIISNIIKECLHLWTFKMPIFSLYNFCIFLPYFS